MRDHLNENRKESQQEILENLGARYVLNSSDSNYREDLAKLSHELKAKLFFDAVGGDQTGIMAVSSPPGSRIILYAMLSEEALQQPWVMITG